MEFIKAIHESLSKHANNNALCINNIFYSYKDFNIEVSKIRIAIQNTIKDSEKLIGLVANDDMQTYAAIIAFWIEGKAYLPINPEHPKSRNQTIINSTEVKYIYDSTKKINFNNVNQISDQQISETKFNLSLKPVKKNDLAYIIFTSGSTGTPKGVPITYNNLNEYINAINYSNEFKLEKEDKCLQMFELTFDFSVVSYIFPLLAGACIYTVPRNSIKYFYIYKLIQKHSLTVLSLVPSIIHYLRPYFSEINAPQVRYCSFGGGALYNNIIDDWHKCLPNSKIFNYYGPTENTIYSSYYTINKDCTLNKTYNDIISIGKPLNNTTYIIIDGTNNEVNEGETGELALSSGQLTPGYWRNKEKNRESFFLKKVNNKTLRFYKTGDLCFKDKTGNYMYIGRIDFQVKIRGFRIELSEVEFHAKAKSTKKVNMVALDVYNKLGNAELGLAIESEPFETKGIFEYMKSKMPSYMIPMHVKFIKEFPHSINGKINRKELKKHFNIN